MAIMSPSKPQDDDNGSLEDLECIPFAKRLRLLRSRSKKHGLADATATDINKGHRLESWNGLLDKEDEHYKGVAIRSPAACAGNVKDHQISQQQSPTGAVMNQSTVYPPSDLRMCCLLSIHYHSCRPSVGPSEGCIDDASIDSCIYSSKLPSVPSGDDFVPLEQLNTADGTLKCPMGSVPMKSEIDLCDGRTPSQDCFRGSDCRYEKGTDMKLGRFDNFDNDLDSITLRERRGMLLSRRSKRSTQPLLAGYNVESSNLSSKGVSQSVMTGALGRSIEVESLIDHHVDSSQNADISCPALVNSNCKIARDSFIMNRFSPSLSDEYQAGDSVESRSSTTLALCKSNSFEEAMTSNPETTVAPTLSSPVRVKVEPLSIVEPQIQERSLWDNFHVQKTFRVKAELRILGEAPIDEAEHRPLTERAGLLPSLAPRILPTEDPTLSYPVNVKAEPLDMIEPQLESKCVWEDFHGQNIFPVKSELSFLDDATTDELDHLPLIKRMWLLPSATQSCQNTSSNFKPLNFTLEVTEPVKPISVGRLKKRKRTATNSAETALVEDAPELLKFLVARGVSVDEIKLYGGIEADTPIDESPCEDGFEDLEAVMSQLFSGREPFIKFPLIRASKAAKASYCLACLLSLVEQMRYMRTRSWPVEWGWCRDLLSFVFVFYKHNRIVLERPEYGYATYFFELLDFLPVEWQIRRLVTTMKLTNCGRITLIENKPLVVGDDLSEGEARVLAEYGWIPNTGLGTMLNYRDRVVHDRQKEIDPCEWRSKIGKLLMEGYCGGSFVCTDVPKKLLDHQSFQSPQVKLEQL